MNAIPDHPELDRLSAELAGLFGRIGLDPSGGRPWRRDRIDVRFASLAARHPGRVAARDEEAEVTYLELEWLADDIARRLSGRAGPGSAVAVRAERSCMTAGAVVGVLRTGASVLPLEPGHGAGLQEFLMRDAGAEVVVSDAGLLHGEIPVVKVGRFVVAVRPQVAGRREVPAGTAFWALPAGGDPGRAVAVRPVSHREVLSWVDGCVPVLGAGLDDVWTFFHSLSLDVGMRELWGPLLSGGRAVVVGRDTACDARAFARLLAKERVTVVTQLPSAFARLGAVVRGGGLPSLRHVLLSDEPVDGAVVARWRSAGIAPQALTWDVSGSPSML
ncbi:AMP-binding protein [Streptomyces sp. NPDC090036]|uniref:AMP-binding protein n=1 Tax=Streptomyces sp. NPDC090036 TaxID=3365926 RepID=UPI0037FAD5BF